MIDYHEALDELGKSIAIDCFNNANKNNNILHVDFCVTQQQMEIIQNYLPGRILINTGRNIENTHPIHAFMTRICYDDIQKELNGFEHVIEIGTSFTRQTNVKHNCVLISDTRTLTRYTQQAVNLLRHNKPLAHDLLDACVGNTSTICSKGAEHCYHKADVGFAVHATYDINLHKMARIMVNHQFKLFYAYMYLPMSLIDPTITTLVNNKYGFDYSVEGRNAIFALGDRSFVYEHNYRVWRSYLATTKIDIFDKHNKAMFTITMEIDREWGPLNRIKFVMTKYSPNPLTRKLPYYPFLNKLVIIPNIFKYIYRDSEVRTVKFNEHLHIPVELANKCLNYISRMPDETYKYSNFEAYFNGQMTEIRFDGNTVWHGWQPETPEELRHVVISLFCIGAANRNDRTKVISNLMRKLQQAEWGFEEYVGRRKRLSRYIRRNFRDKFRRINRFLGCVPLDRDNAAFIRGSDRFEHIIFANLHPQKFQSWSASLSVKTKLPTAEYTTFKRDLNTNADIIVDHDLDLSSIFDQQNDDNNKTQTATTQTEQQVTNKIHEDYCNNDLSINYGTKYNYYYKINEKININKDYSFSYALTNYGAKYQYQHSAINNNTVYDIALDIAMLYPNVTITKRTNRCGIEYSPPPDGYCGRNSLKHYVDNNLPIWVNYRTLIDEALKTGQVLFHLHDKQDAYNCFIPSSSTQTIILAFDISAAHYYVPRCTCGGGLRVAVVHDQSNYKIDTQYWYKHRNLYNTDRTDHRVADKILECIPKDIDKIFEISYAPGHLAQHCEKHGIDYHCGHYVGEGALDPVYKPKYVQEFIRMKDLQKTDRFIISDIGDEQQLAKVIDDVLCYIGNNSCLIKAFTNDQNTVNKISQHLGNYEIIKPTSSFCNNSEIYMLKHGNITDKPQSSNEVIDRITNHIHERKNDYHFDKIECKQRNIDNYCKQLTNSKLHTNIKKAVIRRDCIIPIEYTNGVAGCGKTRNITLSKYDAYVCPLRKLVRRAPNHFTYEVFLVKVLEGARFNAVFVDEAYLIPKGWYGAVYNTNNVRSLVLLGDPFQILLVDFSDSYDHDDVVSFGNGWDNNKTMRFGVNTTRLLNEYVKELPDITCSGKEDKVTIQALNNDNLYDIADGYKVLHFRQEDKKLFKDSNTIHEAQGSTFPKVLLYVDGAELDRQYIRDYRYTYVGMTRHTDELKIVVKSPTSAHTFISLIDSILHINTTDGVEPISDVLLMKNVNRTLQPITEEISDTHVNDLASIEEILQTCGYQPNDNNTVTYMSSNLILPDKINSWGDHSKAKIRWRNLDTKETVIHGFRPSTSNYVRHYAPQNTIQTLHTIITRYMRVAQRRSYKKFTPYFNMCDKLHKGLLKFTAFDKSNDYYDYMSPTFNDLQVHMHDYLVSLQDKMNPKVYHELNELNESIKMSIDFFMKKQPKFMSKPVTRNTRITKALLAEFTAEGIFGLSPLVNDNISTNQKAGQGVSAWPKRFNLIFAAYTRHMMYKFIEMPSRKGTKLVIGVGKSDKEIGAIIGEAISQHLDVFAFKGDDTFISWKDQNKCTDFIEHDTSHSLLVRMMDCYDMIKMGFSANIIAKFWNAYLHWQQNVTGDTPITVENYFMQHSGSPNTIYGNTKLTASANGACFDLRKDGTIHLNKISDVLKADCSGFLKLDEELTDVFGFRLKQDDSNPAEFICNIITPYGMFPDVIRRTARYISKIYVDKEDFEKTRANIRDCVSTVLNEEAKNCGIYYATKYYNDHGMNISSNQVLMLYNFLKSDTLQYYNNKQLYYIETLPPLKSN